MMAGPWGFQKWFGLVLCAALVACGGGASNGAAGSGNQGGLAGSAVGDAGEGGTTGDSADGTSGATEGGSGGGRAGASTVGGSAGESCVCDDGIACTFDDCSSGSCQHTPHHFECAEGKYCSTTKGCVAGTACASDMDCVRPDACVLTHCVAATRRCTYSFLDGDHDGDPPSSCGGADCDDTDPAVHGAGIEVCDGRDNDCDGTVDPPAGSGCGDGKTCQFGHCECLAPNNLCSGACVDYQTDDKNCGSCGKTCGLNEHCTSGSCECDQGLTHCYGVCVDLETDHGSCGACGKSCYDGQCEKGVCACPSGTTSCGQVEGLECKDTATDSNNCGACQKSCMRAAVCQNSSCDVTLQWLKLYGMHVSAPQTHTHQAPMVADAAGNLLVNVALEGGTATALPNGLATLWTGASAIVKFSPEGEFLWAVPSSPVTSMAAVGNDFWVASYATYPISLAGQAFTVPPGFKAITALVKISGADGALLDHFQLDATSWNVISRPQLQSLGTQVWLADSSSDLTRDGVTWQPPSSAYNAYLYPLDGQPLWLPGYLSSFSLDSSKNLVLDLSAPSNATFALAGKSFTTSASPGHLLARYSSTLTPQSALLVANDGLFVTGSTTNTYAITFSLPASNLFYRYDANGVLSSSGTQGPFRFDQARAEQGRIFMIGNSASDGGTYFGHSFFGGYAGVLMTFSEDTLQFEHAASFVLEVGSAYGYGKVQDLVITDGGKSAIVSAVFSRGVIVDNQNYDFSYDAVGLALMKVALH